jgi:ureidoacrylate peracid hydrolase
MDDPLIPPALTAAVAARYGTAHIHAGFDPRRTALLVVDMQNAFLDPAMGWVPCAAAVETIPAINRIAGALREAGGHVAWLQNVHLDEMTDSWSGLYTMLGEDGSRRRAAALAPDRPGFAISAELDVREDAGDVLVVKRRYSAFTPGASDLRALLDGWGVDTLILTGCTTDLCVESTARDAMMLNYKVIVVTDATAAMTPEAHRNALAALYFHFADAMPAEMALAQIASGI